jgi:hypothetical protein
MKREYLGTWAAPDPQFLKAVELWKAYYDDCDFFDGTTGPVPPHRRAASAQYARERRKLLSRQALEAGVTDDILTAARDRALDEYEATRPRAGKPEDDRG